MASSNSNRFNKSDMEDELPLFELLNQIHEEERMGEDELLEMIEGYWRMVKEELATNPVHRRKIPTQVEGPRPRPHDIGISINVENGPYFEVSRDMASTVMGKVAERFLDRFEAEAKLFVNNSRRRPVQKNNNGTQLKIRFTIHDGNPKGNAIYWSIGHPISSGHKATWGYTNASHEAWMDVKTISLTIRAPW